ncbi:hypothetical protein EGR_10906 [Echinococcus granulosus]|uniref:Uncharacterized protein n=1 Tax=Echinococcus granulosus TaxID=6210 RepID=W6U795_ECHGR|nr:hypothetical protein EGR_10906 [Echinococcus granulosus]EUB54232.1 hypothetical protein EGR_10906 [Echinococcus granulosus]
MGFYNDACVTFEVYVAQETLASTCVQQILCAQSMTQIHTGFLYIGLAPTMLCLQIKFHYSSAFAEFAKSYLEINKYTQMHKIADRKSSGQSGEKKNDCSVRNLVDRSNRSKDIENQIKHLNCTCALVSMKSSSIVNASSSFRGGMLMQGERQLLEHKTLYCSRGDRTHGWLDSEKCCKILPVIQATNTFQIMRFVFLKHLPRSDRSSI